MREERLALASKSRKRGLFLILFLGFILFFWELGSTGLFDETPPLFAAAGRAMHLTGDWLTPRVNGLPRFDKPPLVYWMMSVMYSLPGQELWDPLGTWSARFPSAFASLLMMLGLGETLISFPQGNDSFPRRTAVIASLAFALSPLVMIWSRIAVSDALLCGTLGLSLLFQWRRYADPSKTSWCVAWVILAFAVLTKGPIAVVIMVMTICFFGLLQRDFKCLFNRIKPLRGLLITAVISLPWYLIELFVEGEPFWNSFFGYHNFQRLTSVVNNHQQPWWFFGLILVIASLPYTPFLLLAIIQQVSNLKNILKKDIKSPPDSMKEFAFCWLMSVLILFTCAATKLPSYWLPATPAAAILISLSSELDKRKKYLNFFPFLLSFLIALIFYIILLFTPLWIGLVNDPEIPNLALELIASRVHERAAFLGIISLTIGFLLSLSIKKGRLILLQIPFVLFQLFIYLPFLELGDRLRQLPLRQASSLIMRMQIDNEPLAMVGINKPSIHFYTNKIVLYESNDAVALRNLADRLSSEKRNGFKGLPVNSKEASKTLLLIIDKGTSSTNHWKNLNPEVLGEFGVYKVWRLNRLKLESRSNELRLKGVVSDWRLPRPERF